MFKPGNYEIKLSNTTDCRTFYTNMCVALRTGRPKQEGEFTIKVHRHILTRSLPGLGRTFAEALAASNMTERAPDAAKPDATMPDAEAMGDDMDGDNMDADTPAPTPVSAPSEAATTNGVPHDVDAVAEPSAVEGKSANDATSYGTSPDAHASSTADTGAKEQPSANGRADGNDEDETSDFGFRVAIDNNEDQIFASETFTVPVSTDTTVEEVRRMIFDELVKRGELLSIDDVNRVRVRDKKVNRVGKIFRDGKPLRTYAMLSDTKEITFEVLEEPESLQESHPEEGSIVLVAKWVRSTWEVSKAIELYVPKQSTPVDLRDALAAAFGIET